jgi:hypothetical protein
MVSKQTIKHKPSRFNKRAAWEILLLAIKTGNKPESNERLTTLLAGTVDYEHLLFLGEYHGVTPLLAYNLSQAELISYLPETCREKLDRAYRNNIYLSLILSEELSRILAAFRRNRIEAVTLKGTVLAQQLYTNPESRTTNDIDLLISEEKMSQACSILEEMRYISYLKKVNKKHPFHHIYKRQEPFPITIELHWDLKDPNVVAFPISEILSRSQSYQFQRDTTRVLSPEDNLIYIANNPPIQDNHQVKYLCDISRLLEIKRNTLNWDFILDSADSLGIKPIIYYSLKWAREMLDAPVPSKVFKELKPGLCRRGLISFFNQRFNDSLAHSGKLDLETRVIIKSLMVNHIHQSLNVLFRYRNDGKRFQWLRTFAWIPLVFGIAFWSAMTKWTNR